MKIFLEKWELKTSGFRSGSGRNTNQTRPDYGVE